MFIPLILSEWYPITCHVSTGLWYWVDPNTGVQLGESEEIVAYLFNTYGGAGGGVAAT
jgi:hypothetical protein